MLALWATGNFRENVANSFKAGVAHLFPRDGENFCRRFVLELRDAGGRNHDLFLPTNQRKLEDAEIECRSFRDFYTPRFERETRGRNRQRVRTSRQL